MTKKCLIERFEWTKIGSDRYEGSVPRHIKSIMKMCISHKLCRPVSEVDEHDLNDQQYPYNMLVSGIS